MADSSRRVRVPRRDEPGECAETGRSACLHAAPRGAQLEEAEGGERGVSIEEGERGGGGRARIWTRAAGRYRAYTWLI